ncbi:MAG: hypothetical protein L0312_10735 [Acidobacteria bacterium]|nr:hypothetical protein [Acidobacteriota bacterium]
MLQVHIENDRIQIGARFAVSFQRTIRIPDDGQVYPLPPGLGRFPVLRVEDFIDRVPQLWREKGGVFIPMYQREALWIFFSAASWKPSAVIVSLGSVNAVSGEPDGSQLQAEPQNYLVCPNQPWLDGINSGHGSIRQFVAMPLGMGYTVEAMSGEETLGGIQMTVFEPKPGRFPDEPPVKPGIEPERLAMPKSTLTPMGLGAGGAIKQKIYRDPYGLDAWELQNQGRVSIHIVNSLQCEEITGSQPPPTPIDAATYTESGLPWFDLYDEVLDDVLPPASLVNAKTIAARDAELGQNPDEPSFEVPDSRIRKLRGEGDARSSPFSSGASVRRSE